MHAWSGVKSKPEKLIYHNQHAAFFVTPFPRRDTLDAQSPQTELSRDHIMRHTILAGLVLACSTTTAIAGEIPQDPEKSAQRFRDSLTWNRRTLVEAYDKVGKKDPRWDKPAREAMEAAARFFSGQCDPVTEVEAIYVPAKKAIDAGCNDPLVLYLYARSSYKPNYPGPEEQEKRYTAAAKAMESSAYSPLRRSTALIKSVEQKTARKELTPEARKEIIRQLDAALALLPKSMAEDERNADTEQAWLELPLEVLRAHRKLSGNPGNLPAAFEKVDAFLAKNPSFKLLRLKVKANFLIPHAWEARGIGFADKVTEEGWQKFKERMTECRKTLEQAWALSPGDGQVATLMLDVEKGIGGKREDMEMWFERAMKANGNNRKACELKMDWLEPKWYGSEEDLLEFGRECRATKNWRAGITLLAVDPHRRISERIADPKMRRDYWKKEEIWKDIRDVYDEYLLHYPTDWVARSRYAAYCGLCNHWAECLEQYQIIGDNIVYSQNFPEAWVKQTKEFAAKKVKGGQ
jgi:hypothetical protein